MPFISASVISPYNSIRGGAEGGLVPTGLLLDLYPNAAAAYSLRKLRTSYSGPAIEAMKTVGGETFVQDIGFLYDGSLDTESLLSFAASDDVSVAKWYDQSGAGNNDATQISASKQPILVSNGAVNELNGKPTMSFSSPFLMHLNLTQYPFTSGGSATEKSIFAVALNDSTVDQNLYNIADERDLYALTYNRVGNNTYGFLGANYGVIGGNITGQNIISSFAISPSSETFNNAVEGVSSNPVRGIFNSISIGSRGEGSFPMNGNIQEIVMYESNQSANRAGIESNINSNYNIYWDGSQTSLLDDYPNAAAAYSLRALNSAYTGPAIKVRRSSDNEEQDINFLYDGSLNTESLLSFVGAGDGFVTIRYDQSGNGNDLTNISAVNQPKIVLSGQVITENQKPMIDYDGANHYLKTSSGLNFGTSSRSLFLVQKTDVVGFATGRFAISTSAETGSSWGVTPEIYIRASGRVWAGQVSTPTTSTSLISNIYTSGDLVAGNSMWLDGSSITQSGSNDGSINTSNDPMIEGARGEGTFLFDGKIGDTILYQSDQTLNRAGIETNINKNYNIYWDGSQTGLLDDYPNAAAAYSLRALNSAYTGAAIKVRRSSDNEEQDIGLLYDGTLDTSSLLSFVGAGDGFVTTWYDQSGGGGGDALQNLASKQPQIVSSGSVINENGKISVKFNGTTDYIKNNLKVGPTVTAFAVSKIVDEFDYNFIYDSFGTGGRIRLGLRNLKEYFADNDEAVFAQATTPSNGLQNLFFAKHTNSDVSISVNNDTLQTLATTNFYANSQFFNFGARNDGADHFLEGTIQELIFYPSDQTANRLAIQQNINNHYTIY